MQKATQVCKTLTRWCFLLLMAVIITSQAQAQSTETISIRFNRQTLAQSLRQLQEKTSLAFNYDEQQLSQITIQPKNYTNASLNTILDYLVRGSGFTYRPVTGGIAFIKAQPSRTLSGHGSLHGKIVDEETGEPVVAATIQAGGSNVISKVDGSFALDLSAGINEVKVTAVGFTGKLITGVAIEKDQVTEMNIAVARAKGELAGVMVTSNARRETVNALYVRQKNNVAISDGISAEQIRATPDNNSAQVLKRISGLTVQDEKFVTVRGLSERYNNVILNGAALPSTESNRRNFAFDIIPSALVDNIVVNKTATPDLPAEFAGGLVQVTTRDIPAENYTDITIGTGFNTNSTGKPFYALKRNSGELFGFAGKHRTWYMDGKFDVDAYRKISWDFNKEKQAEISRGIPNNFGLRKYSYRPVQNLQFALGRRYNLKSNQVLAFNLAATTRYEESIGEQYRFYPGYYYYSDSLSRIYQYNSMLGALASVAWQGTGYKLAFKSLFNRRLSSSTHDYFGASWSSALAPVNFTNNIYLENTLWHNRLEGEHVLGKSKLRLDWYGDLISLVRAQPDNRVSSLYELDKTGAGAYYILNDNQGFLSEGITIFNARLEEKKKNIGANLTLPFQLFQREHKIKAGYAIQLRDAETGTLGLRLFWNGQVNPQRMYDATYGLRDYQIAVPELLQPELLYFKMVGINGIGASDDYYGHQRIQATYLMTDLRILEKLRVAGGVRYERNYMTLNGITYNKITGYPVDSLVKYNTNNWLPSGNITYSLNSKMNLRAAYSQTLSRADFRERSTYIYYDANERTVITGATGLKDATIKNIDLRYEYYPGPGEVLSFSLFYKKFKDPVEMVATDDGQGGLINYFFNLESSTNKGVEIDFRKSLGFVSPASKWLRRIFISGNGSWMKSDVQFNVAKLLAIAGQGGNVNGFRANRERPLQGLSPYVINSGLGYFGEKAGINVVYNRYGRRIVVAGGFPYQDQYENPRDIIDLQLSARFLKKKLEARFNISDLLQQKQIIYQNVSSTKPGLGSSFTNDKGEALGINMTEINVNNDPKGLAYNKELDFIRASVFKGINVSLNISYHF